MRSECWTAQYNHNQLIPERTTVRHEWARIIEGTDAPDDEVTHPYSNWGYANRLDFVLAQIREKEAE